MGFLCIFLVLVVLCETSAKKGIREETQKEKKVHLKDIFSGRMKRYENTVEPSFKNNQESNFKNQFKKNQINLIIIIVRTWQDPALLFLTRVESPQWV